MKNINMYINKLSYIIDEYHNTYHRTIKMKTIDVISSAYFDFEVKEDDKNSKFKVGVHVRISKYKNTFA